MEWNLLRDAYGPATEIPELLAEAGASEREDGLAWRELRERLLHDGQISPASLAALEPLADLAVKGPSPVARAALDLAAGIVAVAWADPTCEQAVPRRALRRLRDLGRSSLAEATGDDDFLRLLESVMAFEQRSGWYGPLQDLSEGQLQVTCPRCGREQRLAVGTITTGDPEEHPDGRRMVELAREHGRDALVGRLALLFGRATCPVCGDVFEMHETVDG
ncbi:hypothetical protein [Luteococcus peritonei]|uniref:Uncharacterized protein n=1 Tax=Luteococcus peritonei TaxID=88874 RepID=A0ABW4RW16_9ACTN